MTEITANSLVSLTELIRSREASPVEVVHAYLDRIDEINPKLNAIVTLAPDVIEQARAAETADDSWGSLVCTRSGEPLRVRSQASSVGVWPVTANSLVTIFHVPSILINEKKLT